MKKQMLHTLQKKWFLSINVTLLLAICSFKIQNRILVHLVAAVVKSHDFGLDKKKTIMSILLSEIEFVTFIFLFSKIRLSELDFRK